MAKVTVRKVKKGYVGSANGLYVIRYKGKYIDAVPNASDVKQIRTRIKTEEARNARFAKTDKVRSKLLKSFK